MGNSVPRPQKALVLQGGGALGAYEAGVFKAFYDRYFRQGEPFFDVIAGVSIGAVNASILASHAKSKGWKDSSDTLHRFWRDVSTPGAQTPAWQPAMDWLGSGFFKQYWDHGSAARKNWGDFWRPFSGQLDTQWPSAFYFFRPDKLGPLATGEAARRYYAWKQFLLFGTPNVLSPGMMQWDFKFLDLFSPSSGLLRFDNAPLARVIERYWQPNTAIATSFEKGEPRLLFVSVDLESGTTATFDSYEKTDENGNKARRTVYGEDREKHVIDYPAGLEMKHLMTSMSSHLKYEYPALDASDGNGQPMPRHFWDGVYLSNTPLRELLQAHHDYWRGSQIPKLEVYIVNLYPTREKQAPVAPDEIQDRQYTILFNDRTVYDEKVAHIVSDYVDLGKRLRDLASKATDGIGDPNEKNAAKQELDEIMKTRAKSQSRDGGDRRYSSLLEGKFEVDVYRIEREADSRDIYGKAFDFTAATIDELLEQGESETIDKIKAGKIKWTVAPA